MFHDDVVGKVEAEKPSTPGKESSAGKSLKKIFRQDETLKKIENQPASVSMLMNPIRLSLFLHLCQNPCDHTRSIARNMGVTLTGINWHLGQLFQKGYLESINIKGKRVYWPTGMVMQEDILIVKTIRNEWAQQIIKVISENNGETRQKCIVSKMQTIQQNVNVWLDNMTTDGLLEKHGHRMNARYSVATKIPLKVAEYDDAAKGFSANILISLRNDGLMPNKPRFRGSRLSVNVKLPSGKRRLNIECSPMAPLRRVSLNDK
jgi:predicted transcriptional regulator